MEGSISCIADPPRELPLVLSLLTLAFINIMILSLHLPSVRGPQQQGIQILSMSETQANVV